MLNERLKALRASKNLNQNEIAQELGISLSSYQKYERKKNSVIPSLDVLIRIADFYDVSLDFLLGRCADKEIPPLNTEIETVSLFQTLPPKYRTAFTELLKEMVEDLGNSDDKA